jgi:transposase
VQLVSDFAQPVLGRDQRVLIQTTLDDAVSEDHEVRLLDEVLRAQDWSAWEAEYSLGRGQPPIRPIIVASVILYGMLLHIRSSRFLEYLTGHNVDFMWLTSGRTIDHSTLCKFRTRFGTQLKELFRGLCRTAMTMGLIRLGEVTFDGTRVKSSNGRFETWTAAAVEKRLRELEAEFGKLLEDAERTDSAENELLGSATPGVLPPELADAKARQEHLKEALKQLQDADAARRSDGIDPNKNPAQLPCTDPDSRVLPNKEGGYAPNYTPTVAVDTHRDFIVDAEVIGTANENTEVVPMVERVEAAFGQQPEAVLADGLNATGPNIVELEERGVEFVSPPPSTPEPGENPAVREDPRQPVPESEWSQLPMSPHTKKFDKSCFVFVPEKNLYFCPMGNPMPQDKTKPKTRQGQKVNVNVYRCGACEGCPLAGQCITDKNQGGRTISRDSQATQRERHAEKMRGEEARARYARRFHAGETPFGWLKHVLGLRQFSLRGLSKVRLEWLWACTGYNLRKLINEVRRLRAKYAALAAGEGN